MKRCRDFLQAADDCYYSRGYSLEVDGEKPRVIGLNNEGGLSVLLEGEKSEIQSIEKLTWLF